MSHIGQRTLRLCRWHHGPYILQRFCLLRIFHVASLVVHLRVHPTRTSEFFTSLNQCLSMDFSMVYSLRSLLDISLWNGSRLLEFECSINSCLSKLAVSFNIQK